MLGRRARVLAVVVAELMASTPVRLSLARFLGNRDSPALFVTVILLAVIGLVSFNLIKRLDSVWRSGARRRMVVGGVFGEYGLDHANRSTILRVGSVLAGLVMWHAHRPTVINDTTFLCRRSS